MYPNPFFDFPLPSPPDVPSFPRLLAPFRFFRHVSLPVISKIKHIGPLNRVSRLRLCDGSRDPSFPPPPSWSLETPLFFNWIPSFFPFDRTKNDRVLEITPPLFILRSLFGRPLFSLVCFPLFFLLTMLWGFPPIPSLKLIQTVETLQEQPDAVKPAELFFDYLSLVSQPSYQSASLL